MTKAEQIYTATRCECIKTIENWGYKTNPNGTAIGCSKLATDKETSTRTINDITKILDRKYKDINIDKDLGILTEAEAKKETQILNMIKSTVNNRKQRIIEFNEELKNIVKKGEY